MSNNNKLSVVLATYNEEEHLGRCLESISGLADEIVVADGASTDRTVEIARHYNAHIIATTNKPNFHINKQMAMDEATGDWVLQLDADEVVDEEMHQAIETVLNNGGAYDAYWLRRKNYFLGRFLTKGGQYPDPVIRFYKAGKARLPQQDVHEQMQVDGEVGWLDGHLLHYNAPSFRRYVTNSNRYTSLTAQQLFDSGVRLSVWNDLKYLVFKPSWIFGLLFFRHRGYKDGFPGFVFALFSGLHHGLSYMKLGDLYRHARSH